MNVYFQLFLRRHRPDKSPLFFVLGLLCLVLLVAPTSSVAKTPTRNRGRAETVRFRVRLQSLTGLAPTFVSEVSEGVLSKKLAAFVPLDVEIGTRLSGPLSVSAGALVFLAPFSSNLCDGGVPYRPHAAAGLFGIRLDLNNNRDGSWWSPFVVLRMGVGTQTTAGDFCSVRVQIQPMFSPRIGADLWMGKAAATFAIGYDLVPTGSIVTVQAGLTLRVN